MNPDFAEEESEQPEPPERPEAAETAVWHRSVDMLLTRGESIPDALVGANLIRRAYRRRQSAEPPPPGGMAMREPDSSIDPAEDFDDADIEPPPASTRRCRLT